MPSETQPGRAPAYSAPESKGPRPPSRRRPQAQAQTNTPEEAARRDTTLDLATAGFALEATAARDALDMIEFIGDASGLRETMKDPETYMSGDMDQEAQELLDLLIRKVTVDNEQTTIVYHIPMPADGAPKEISQDTVPMGPRPDPDTIPRRTEYA